MALPSSLRALHNRAGLWEHAKPTAAAHRSRQLLKAAPTSKAGRSYRLPSAAGRPPAARCSGGMGRMAPASCIFAPAAAAFCRARRAKWPSEEGGGSSPSGSHATPVRCSLLAGRKTHKQGVMVASKDSTRRRRAELPLQPTHLPAPHLRRCWQLQRPRLQLQPHHWQPEWRCCAGQRERLHSGAVRRQCAGSVGGGGRAGRTCRGRCPAAVG